MELLDYKEDNISVDVLTFLESLSKQNKGDLWKCPQLLGIVKSAWLSLHEGGGFGWDKVNFLPGSWYSTFWI